MLLMFFLIFLLCESTVKLQMTAPHLGTPYPNITITTGDGKDKQFHLQLVATPDYPVAEGQRVQLYCKAFTKLDNITWSWHHLENQTWRKVGSDRTLTLTEPEHSGLYYCSAENLLQQSPNHTVYIISMRATVGENLGVAAFVLSLLALNINLGILVWLGWQRLGDTLTASNTAAKGLPGPEKSPKGGLPQSDSDGDVYMNYSSNNQAYSDLDYTTMNVDDVYSGLS